MSENKYSSMTGPELIAAYNEMAEAKGFVTVNRFSSTQKGIERCLAMEGYAKIAGSSEPAPKKEKKQKVKQAKAKEPGLLGDFDAREGTIRKLLINELIAHFGNQVPIRTLIAKCYGKDEKGKSAIFMVMKGVEVMIKKHKIGVTLKRERDEKKEVSYGLYKS